MHGDMSSTIHQYCCDGVRAAAAATRLASSGSQEQQTTYQNDFYGSSLSSLLLFSFEYSLNEKFFLKLFSSIQIHHVV